MTCQEAIELLGEYLEATPGAGSGTELETHLQHCDECVAYLNTYRRTAWLTRAIVRVEMPTRMRERLHDVLISRLGRA